MIEIAVTALPEEAKFVPPNYGSMGNEPVMTL